ncbi:MAG: UPF0280 family protein [Sphaerochaeta sp.]|nr:UPF0280 family protein [Sphaerochaeta sp.]
MYQRRAYRTNMGSGRFTSLSLAVGESDLYIGYRGAVEVSAIEQCALKKLRRLRQEILDYPDHRLLTTLVPLFQHEERSPLLASMLASAEQANVGPMAAVAGAIAQELGRHLRSAYPLTELVIENGGDLYLFLTEPLPVKLLAPSSPFSNKLALMANGEIGIATSSATMGHSLSFGRADAVMVAALDAALADALATSYCNRVQCNDDAQPLCQALTAETGVIGAVIAIGDTVAIGGSLEVCHL